MALQRAGIVSPALVSLTASTTLVPETHSFTTVVVSAAAGLTLTLPDATGSGDVYKIVVGTTVTSNDYIIQVPDANNVMTGNFLVAQDAADTAVIFEAAATSDTITMNGTTKGGLKGAVVTLTDIAADTWLVEGVSAATGTEVTPFSAAVS